MFNDENVAEHFTYKVVPVADGSLYGWNKYNDAGEVVESSQQSWPSAADAEKAIRAIAPNTDTVEVNAIHNINTDSNKNVEVVKPGSVVNDRFAGATPVEKGVEERNQPEDSEDKESPEDDEVTGSDHVVTQEDLDNNPELADRGIQVGDTIQI